MCVCVCVYSIIVTNVVYGRCISLKTEWIWSKCFMFFRPLEKHVIKNT